MNFIFINKADKQILTFIIPFLFFCMAIPSITFAGAFNIEIGSTVISGGSWSGGNPDIFTANADDATVLASDIATKLNSGTSVTISTGSGGTQYGTITVTSSIEKTGGTDATATFKSTGSIILNSGVAISSTSNKLDTILWADSDGDSDGCIRLLDTSSITTNGGGVWLGGGSGSTTWTPWPGATADISVGDGFSAGNATDSNGIFLEGSTINTNGGNIAMYGQGRDGTQAGGDGAGTLNGIHFSSLNQVSLNSGAGTIYLHGKANSTYTSAQIGIMLNSDGGSHILTSSASTGDAITLFGEGGSGSDSNNNGIQFQTGSISATGGGNILLRGTEGAVPTLGYWGALQLNWGTINASSGDLMLEGDTISLGTGNNTTLDLTLDGTGQLIVRPVTANTAINIGPEGESAGPLIIPSRYFNNTNCEFSDGFSEIIIGSDAAGLITVGDTAFSYNDPLTLKTRSSIFFSTSSNVTGNNNALTLWSRAWGNDAADDTKVGAVWLPIGSSVNTGGGDITIGGGTDPAAGYALTDNDDTSTENNARYRGVTINGTLNASGGNIFIRGRGGIVSATRGVSIGGSIGTTGSGNITINGIAKGGSDGVALGDGSVSGTTGALSAVDGTIDITGAKDTGSNGFNMAPYSGQTADITLSGNGNLNINTTGAINSTESTSTVSVGGATTLTASGDIVLPGSGKDFTGTVSVVSGVDVTITDSNAMTLGSITSTGLVDIATLSGNLTLTGAITTTNTTASALQLNAGKSESAGTSTGGDIVVSGGSASVGSGGTALLYTGSVSGSTGVTGLSDYVSSYYSSDETSGLTPGAGLFVVYREAEPPVTVTKLQEFSTSNSLTDNFTEGTNGSGDPFVWDTTAGLGGGGGILVSTSSSDQIWTTKEYYNVTEGGVYTLSAYFKMAANAGYGALGFSTESVNSASGSNGMPGSGNFLGISFHGGGGNWLNNALGTALSWGGDMTYSPATWYFFELIVEAKTGTNFDLTFRINESDANGNIGTLHTEHTTTLTNSDIAGASALYVFFSADGSRTGAIDNFEIQLTGGVDIFYSVTYEGNGADSGTPPTDGNSYAEGDSITALGNTGSLEKAGYDFAGWNTASDGSGTTYQPGDTFTMGSMNMTLYAVWSPVDRALYFDGIDDDCVISNPSDMPAGSGFYTWEAWVYALTTTTGDLKFLSWGEATVTSGSVQIGFTPAGLVCMNHWSNDYTTNFQMPENTWIHLAGTYNGSTETLYVNGVFQDSITAGSLSVNNLELRIGDLVSGNYSQNFHGALRDVRIWKDALDAQTINDWKDLPVTASHPDYANLVSCFPMVQTSPDTTVTDSKGSNDLTINDGTWIEGPLNVTYNDNGATSGSAPTDANDYDLGAEVTALGPGTILKTNFSFSGWNTELNGTGSSILEGDTFFVLTSDEVLYAQWTSTYTITYNGNGNTGGTAPSAQTKTHDVDLTLATNSGGLTKTGYTFAGWNTAADGLGTDYAAGATYTANASITLYAKWLYEHHSLQFNADSVQNSNGPQFTGTIPFSIEAWVKLGALGCYQTIVSKYIHSGANGGYELGISNENKPRFMIGNNWNSWTEAVSSVSIQKDQWYHIAGTYDGSNLRIYVDGTLVGTEAWSGGLTDSNQDFMIGMRDSGEYSINGTIDEVRVWNVVRSQTDIADNKDYELVGNESNLLLYYKMNEGAGTIAYDSTANGNNGTLSGSTWVVSDLSIQPAIIVTHTVALNARAWAGSGTVESQTVNNTTSPVTVTKTVNFNETTTFSITPSAGSTATATGCGGTLSGTTYTTGAITENCNVTATFTLNSYTITGSAGTGGTISPASRTVNYNGTTTFTIIPDWGYQFNNFTGNCPSGTWSGNTYTTGVITGDCTLNATFTPKTYTVTGGATANGKIDGEEESIKTVNHGGTTSFTITPEDGFTINYVLGCNGSLSGTTYTTGSITGPCKVIAFFK